MFGQGRQKEVTAETFFWVPETKVTFGQQSVHEKSLQDLL